MHENYATYRKKELLPRVGRLGRELQGPMAAFGQLHRSAMADGALPSVTKELIALGIAVASRCQGCIAFHVHDARKAGATRAQIVDSLGVALLMGGGPSMVYASEALQALDDFERGCVRFVDEPSPAADATQT